MYVVEVTYKDVLEAVRVEMPDATFEQAHDFAQRIEKEIWQARGRGAQAVSFVVGHATLTIDCARFFRAEVLDASQSAPVLP
jgi:hypothetical protein